MMAFEQNKEAGVSEAFCLRPENSVCLLAFRLCDSPHPGTYCCSFV